MTLYLNQFKALLWKEYRECRPFFWLSLLFAVVVPLGSYKVVIDSSGRRTIEHLQELGANLDYLVGVQAFYIVALAFVFFLPILSREPERDNLVCLNTKPLTPEFLSFYQWLSGFCVGMVGILISANLVHWIYQGVAFWKYLSIVVGIFVAFSLCFFAVSCMTANRLRSFGLLLLLFPTTMIILSYMHELRRSAPYGLSASILYYFQANPFLSIGILVLIVAVISAAVLRIRMTSRLSYWQTYAGLFAGLVVLFLLTMYVNVKNTNAKLAAIEVDGIVVGDSRTPSVSDSNPIPSDDPIVQWAARNSTNFRGAYASFKNSDGGLKPYAAFVEGERGPDYAFSSTPWRLAYKYENFEPTRLTIQKCDESGKISIVFDKPLSECFQSQNFDMETQRIMERFHVWETSHVWRMIQSEKGGILYTTGVFLVDLLGEYIHENGGGFHEFREIWEPDIAYVDGEPIVRDKPLTYRQIKEKYRHFFEYVEHHGGPKYTEDCYFNKNAYRPYLSEELALYGQFTFGDNPTFTPLKKMEFGYKKGSEWIENTITASQPGYFLDEDFSEAFTGLPYEERMHDDRLIYVYSEDKLNEIEPELRYDVSHACDIALWIQRGYLWYMVPKDGFSDFKVFHLETVNRMSTDEPIDGNSHFNMRCLDFTDPETLKISVGCELMKTLPSIRGVYYSMVVPFAIDGNKLAAVYHSFSNQYISVFDISDPKHIKEVSRQKNSLLSRMSNWHYATGRGSDALIFKNGFLYAPSMDNLFVYQYENNRFRPYARILQSLPNEGIVRQLWIRETGPDEVAALMMGEFDLAQYVIGKNTSLNTKDGQSVSVFNIPKFADNMSQIEKWINPESDEGGAS